VEEVREIDLEDLIAKNPNLLEKELTLAAMQVEVLSFRLLRNIRKPFAGNPLSEAFLRSFHSLCAW
jgi:hypothetical protein